MNFVVGFIAPLVVYLVVLALHVALPARTVDGYVVDAKTGRLLRYRLNGLAVLLVVIFLWAVIAWFDVLPAEWLYLHAWGALAGACVLGLVYTVVLVHRAPSTGKPYLVDLFLGRVENLQYGGRIDVKMILYLAGAVMLVLNAVSTAIYHAIRFSADLNPGVLLHAGLLIFFVLDYLWFERVHLYTYDLFAERIGFKLAWGCLVFYPFFYPVGLWSTAYLPTPALIVDYGTVWLVGSACVFLFGWALARGANMQKYQFKRFPDKPFLGRLAPQVVSDGRHNLLCNGFWGAARHINYLGEIVMATGLALSLGHPELPWPWLYPLYYVLLLTTRERDDDRRCSAKYGALWDVYKAKVPKRIVPGIY